MHHARLTYYLNKYRSCATVYIMLHTTLSCARYIGELHRGWLDPFRFEAAMTATVGVPVTTQRHTMTAVGVPITTQRHTMTAVGVPVTTQRHTMTAVGVPVTTQRHTMTAVGVPLTTQRPNNRVYSAFYQINVLLSGFRRDVKHLLSFGILRTDKRYSVPTFRFNLSVYVQASGSPRRMPETVG
jgi:hypothetical protein